MVAEQLLHLVGGGKVRRVAYWEGDMGSHQGKPRPSRWFRAPAAATVGMVVLLVLLLVATLIVPDLVITSPADVPNQQMSAARSALRGNLLQAFGALFFIVTAVTAWHQLRLNQRTLLQRSEEISANLALSAEQARIANETLSTERFSRAVTQLGDTAIAIRLGGVYALTRLAEGSPQEKSLAIDVLCAYIRTWSPSDAVEAAPVLPLRRRAMDVQAALTFVASTPFEARKMIDLSGADLRGCDLVGAHLRRADLSYAVLDEAVLIGADLNDANLREARLDQVSGSGIRLGGADLGGASLRGADLTGAQLHHANIADADFTGAVFAGVKMENTIGRAVGV
ncbi:pentapeptide repeat-containing protein [Amycolatopsis sp. H6(2020)]|nr:pentapeptide repeat-containing protein [Amycolatopsis sp. H6(2020)]